MTPERWRRVEELYDAALAQPITNRAAFLAQACGGDEDVRAEVDMLLAQRASSLTGHDGVAAAAAGSSDLVGRRIGDYQIQAQIGAGGMGEVYRAHDTRLRRDVAIKTLPRLFTGDAERLARFDREARMLAALNHPHIGAIYGVVDIDGTPALVLELIDGETLADRIARGPIPPDESLAIARQLADALAAAHGKAIVHRDLKPANIKISDHGFVKVLDFGLAKVAMGGAALPSPTVSFDATRPGLIVGTVAYMSPEQARGKAIDNRTDVWAFGCVLFEMISGRHPFAGETITDTMAAILERDPAWVALPTATPASVRRLLERCLDKDVTRRLSDIGGARRDLEDAASQRTWSGSPSRGPVWTRHPIGGVLLVAAAIAAAWFLFDSQPQRLASVRTQFAQVTSASGVEWFPSLSPDGSWVAYAGESDSRDIFLQSVTGTTPINLTSDSDQDDDQPAFSPDGERIAFRSNRDGGGIFVMGRTGEAVRRVTRGGYRPSWSPDGANLVYATQNVEISPQNTLGSSELWVVRVSSGEQKQLDAGDAALPSWSRGGDRIAYTKRLGESRQRDIWTISLSTGESTPVTNDVANDWSPSWGPEGFLYFSSDRAGSMNLWRVAIAEVTGSVRSDPEPITTPAPFLAHAAISRDGSRVAYSAVNQVRNIQRIALDPRTGLPTGDPSWLTTGSRSWSNPDPSPDRQSVAFYSGSPSEKLYIARNDGIGLRQLTTDPAVIDRVPRWSPDGRWIAFFSNRTGLYQLWKIRPDGSDLQQLTEVHDDVRFPVWAPDGSRIAVTVIGKTPEAGQVFVFDPDKPWKAQRPDRLPDLQTPRTLFLVNSWSPDGRRLAGQAGTVSQGIVIYDLRSGTFRRLTDSGEFPVWLPDSQRLLFVSGGSFFVVDAASGAVTNVFSVSRDVIGPMQVSRDGREGYFSRRITEADVWLLTVERGKESH
jgi:serine/threonine protein kinase